MSLVPPGSVTETGLASNPDIAYNPSDRWFNTLNGLRSFILEMLFLEI